MNEPTTWGTRIEEQRIAAGMTVPELARAVGVHPATVYYWQKSEHAPHRDVMLKVATILKAEPCHLWFPECGEAA